MAEKKELENITENGVEKYRLQAPDGGWGYVIAVNLVVVFSLIVIPMIAFGLIFGEFLQTVGDETTGTALSNGVMNTVQSFTGLLANGVLNRYSYRKVGVAGIIIFTLGTLGVVFSHDLILFILFFGVVEGFGCGLLVPAIFSAFNSYFVERITFVMSVAQCFLTAGNMAAPLIAAWSMGTFGYRGTLIGIVLTSLACLPLMLLLQPVEWHMKKVPLENVNMNDTFAVLTIDPIVKDKKSLPADVLKTQIEPLLNQEEIETENNQKSLHEKTAHPKPRPSIISLGDRVGAAAAINNFKDKVDKDLSIWQSFKKSMDMSLLGDLRYLIISTGVSLCVTGDFAFLSVIPLMLGNSGFQPHQSAFLMTVLFGADLVGRIILAVISGIFKLRSRIIILVASLFTVIFRIAWVCSDDYMWKLYVIAALGFSRAFIQTPAPLVFSEEYPDNFATAFSLFMAVNGVVSLAFGPLMSVIKAYTDSDAMVCHSLTLAFIICIVAWTIEMTLCRKKKRKPTK